MFSVHGISLEDTNLKFSADAPGGIEWGLRKAADEKAMAEGRYDLAKLASAKVVELRAMARRIASFPIKGRDVARAGRDELLAAFRALNG